MVLGVGLLIAASFTDGETVPGLVSVGLLVAVLVVLVAYERVRFAELRGRLRAQLVDESPSR